MGSNGDRSRMTMQDSVHLPRPEQRLQLRQPHWVRPHVRSLCVLLDCWSTRHHSDSLSPLPAQRAAGGQDKAGLSSQPHQEIRTHHFSHSVDNFRWFYMCNVLNWTKAQLLQQTWVCLKITVLSPETKRNKNRRECRRHSNIPLRIFFSRMDLVSVCHDTEFKMPLKQILYICIAHLSFKILFEWIPQDNSLSLFNLPATGIWLTCLCMQRSGHSLKLLWGAEWPQSPVLHNTSPKNFKPAELTCEFRVTHF